MPNEKDDKTPEQMKQQERKDAECEAKKLEQMSDEEKKAEERSAEPLA